MNNKDEIRYRCPFGDRLFSFVIAIILITNAMSYSYRVEATNDIPEVETNVEVPVQEIIVESIELETSSEPIEEITTVSDIQSVDEEPLRTEELFTEHVYTRCLTKSGGVYNNPYTGLKETWYSQRVLPGGGLNIPGRHVNEEGFVCDIDGYICVASSTYSKGTIIETSRGMGKVYDCGCAPGILDVYVDW